MTATRDKLIELRFEHGMTREDIAEYFDVSIATVRRWIKEMDIPRPRSLKPKRHANMTASGEIIVPMGDTYTRMERAKIVLGGRLINRKGRGYYLDGRPADVDTILTTAQV